MRVGIKNFFINLFRISGLLLLYKKLIYKIVKLKKTALISCQGYKMYVNTKDRGITPILLIEGVFEKYVTRLFKETIRPNMVVVDIGANIGYYTLIASKLVGSNGKVYAFEPEPNNYDLLLKNIRINGYTNATPVKKAVSNKCDKTTLFLDKVSSGDPSLDENNVPQKKGFIEVETVTLDSFLKDVKVDVVKIDAQGAEGLILEGSERILRNNNLKLFMEFWPYGLRNMGTNPLELLYKLQSNGFKATLVGKRTIKYIEAVKVIEVCDNAVDKKECVDLLLEKPQFV